MLIEYISAKNEQPIYKERLVHKSRPKFLIPESLPPGDIKIAFSTRLGGVSEPPFDSLNLGFKSGDKSEAVLENRRVLAKSLDLDLRVLTFAHQVHADNVTLIDKSLVGAGNGLSPLVLPETDGLITGLEDVGLVVLSADCLPIILIDPLKKICAAVHAGWRGTLKRIAAKTVADMMRQGAVASRIKAFLGPAIGECCMEVASDLFEQFSTAFDLGPVTEKPHLNLPGINETILIGAGLLPQNIENMKLCTSCRPDLFFSWRRDGQTGRQGAIVIRSK